MTEPKKRGRPKSKQRMKQITIKLPLPLLEELKELSEKSYISRSFHIRQAVIEYLGKQDMNYIKNDIGSKFKKG
ncbi:ribbon-helix-helix protein, CopG family [Methanobacterium formicicum]|uniref:Ribbon-helix-helix protein CopG domain-containing protein n=1 Tax=Methanobacterium formicicum (strain DSM 3637 / PP1) TaxID=1204725 RepID=K2RVT7_METFP|nr:ribbon-helix-helix protein, CopG family [Methanobacterium formicicum]EKF86845.1 hypothetical protein A994_01125 [Methanobacterium formicicum DSM 3637]